MSEANPHANPTVNEGAAEALRVVIWLLLVVYALPLIAVTVSYIYSSQFFHKDSIVEMFISLTKPDNDPLVLLHRALLPLMAGLTPFAFLDKRASRHTIFLMIFLVLTIALSIFLLAVFKTASVENNLASFGLLAPGVSDPTAREVAIASAKNQIYAFLNRTQETVLMYLLLLFGLTMAKK